MFKNTSANNVTQMKSDANTKTYTDGQKWIIAISQIFKVVYLKSLFSQQQQLNSPTSKQIPLWSFNDETHEIIYPFSKQHTKSNFIDKTSDDPMRLQTTNIMLFFWEIYL